jgi:DNA polymerase delta subunit 2
MRNEVLKNNPSEDRPSAPTRSNSDYHPLHTFDLPKGADRHYAQQFADMYFLRLAHLKKAVKAKAHDAWEHFEVRRSRSRSRSRSPRHVRRR